MYFKDAPRKCVTLEGAKEKTAAVRMAIVPPPMNSNVLPHTHPR